MANEKILNTRVQLKYDSYTNWTTNNPTLLAGEIAIAKLTTTHAVKPTENDTQAPVLFKVGPGQFNDLPWASALAADVYDWAKAENLSVVRAASDGETAGNVISSITWNTATKKIEYTTASVATSEGMAELQEAVDAIEKDIADNRADWAEKTVDTNTDTQYSFETTDDNKLKVYKTLYTLGVAGNREEVGTYEFLSQTEVETILADYYTKTEVNNLLNEYTKTEDIPAIKVDEAVHATDADNAQQAQTAQQATLALEANKVTSALTIGTATFDGSIATDATAAVKALAADEINTLIGGVSDKDTIENINTLITYVNENGANTTTILTELYGPSADTTGDSRIDALEGRAGLDKVGTVTSITAGDGLDGGTITESGTISLSEATKASLAKADTAVQPAALNSYYTKTEADAKFLEESEVKSVKVDNAAHADAASKVDNKLSITANGSATEFDGSAAQSLNLDNIYLKAADYVNTTYTADESTLHLEGTTFSVKDKGVTTAKIADHAVGAEQTKAYRKADKTSEEVWVFYCGTSAELV